MPSSILTDAGLFYCAAVWGASFYMIKNALGAVNPIALVAYRFILSAFFLLPWVMRRPRPWLLLKESAVLSSMLAVLCVSQTVGLGYTTASNSGFITGLFIFFVPMILFLFFRKPPTRAQWFAVGLALAGLWLLTGGARDFNKGDALTLLSAVTYASHLLATDVYVKGDVDMVVLAFHQFWMTGLACLALAVAAGASLRVQSTEAIGVILFLTLLPTLSAFFIQMSAQKRTSPVKVALIFSFEPVFAAIFAWTLGGETFQKTSALGGGLIVAGMIVNEASKIELLKGRKKEVLPV